MAMEGRETSASASDSAPRRTEKRAIRDLQKESGFSPPDYSPAWSEGYTIVSGVTPSQPLKPGTRDEHDGRRLASGRMNRLAHLYERQATLGDQVDPALERAEVPWGGIGEVVAEAGP